MKNAFRFNRKMSRGTLIGLLGNFMGIIIFILSVLVSVSLGGFGVICWLFCAIISTVAGIIIDKREAREVIIKQFRKRQRMHLKRSIGQQKKHPYPHSSFSKLLNMAQKLSVEGETEFKKGNLKLALERYQKALRKFQYARKDALGRGETENVKIVDTLIHTCKSNLKKCVTIINTIFEDNSQVQPHTNVVFRCEKCGSAYIDGGMCPYCKP